MEIYGLQCFFHSVSIIFKKFLFKVQVYHLKPGADQGFSRGELNFNLTKLIFRALSKQSKDLFRPNFLRRRHNFEKTGQKGVFRDFLDISLSVSVSRIES